MTKPTPEAFYEGASHGGWHQWWEGGGFKERVWEGECNRNITYSCMKMEK
jgi:hypothetical protein